MKSFELTNVENFGHLISSKEDSFSSHLVSFSDYDNLKNIPLLPLFEMVRKSSDEELLLMIPHLSSSQRQGIFDLDLWQKDQFNFPRFFHWVNTYSKIEGNESLKSEFVQSAEFLLFLKLGYTISTFDVEDPIYPEHENFFITDDQLLLFEYQESFPHTDEIQNLIRIFYAENGVENSYAHLFKMVADLSLNFQEKEYLEKKSRCLELGIVDYYDALPLFTTFNNINQVNNFIKEKIASLTKKSSSSSDSNRPSQFGEGHDEGHDEDHNNENDANLNESKKLTNVPPQSHLENVLLNHFIKNDFIKITDPVQKHQIIKNGLHLINGLISFRSLFDQNSIYQKQEYQYLSQSINLAVLYIKEEFSYLLKKNSVFDFFFFADLFKIGNSLFEIPRKRIKKIITTNGFSTVEKNKFLGDFLINFINESQERIPRIESKLISTTEQWTYFNLQSLFFKELVPFINKIHETFAQLKNSNSLSSIYYLNYPLEEISFENILLSMMIQFSINEILVDKKIGISFAELNLFISKYFNFTPSLNVHILKDKNDPELKSLISKFCSIFGISEIKVNLVNNLSETPSENLSENYLIHLIDHYMNSVNYDVVSEEEIQYIGGPILLRNYDLRKNDDQKDVLSF